ncbi:cytochrome P450 [Yinghuangia seranimata]|uniref:cytochrome P450 n=1 Tax=Yinghuangia seranimata TaxID=408067 RepID=UPI00248B962A|nr:cytochrome P450 [Yinghuangia seranimata]MDI2130685.1 cytochrome P450 [Yinghuangia seranimata]
MSTSMSQARFVPCGADTWRDPYGMYASLQDTDPLHHVEDGDYWVLSRFADVSHALRTPEVYSSRQGLTFTYGDMEAIGLDEAAPMVMLDPPEHTDFRRLITKGFTPRRVESIEPEVRRFVRARLDRIAAAGGEVDIVAELFKPLPSFVVAHYLGVDEADRARFDEWTDGIVAANASGDPLGAGEAVSGLFDYFTALIERRRAAPADDTISDLIQIMGDDMVAMIRILGFAFTMVAGGNDTTTGLLGGAAELLTAHPDQRRLLVDEPDRIPRAVEEFLRLASPVQALARTLTEDLSLHGRSVPAGRKVLLLYGAANRDPREYGADAARLDVTRSGHQHAAFGFGPHHCLGAAAARLQGRVVLEELLSRFPEFSVDAARGTFAGGSFVRRYGTLPFTPGPDAGPREDGA